jgi:hypothetical protein
MYCDTRRPPTLGSQCRVNRIRLDINRAGVPRIAGLPHGGDMINIDAEEDSHFLKFCKKARI